MDRRHNSPNCDRYPQAHCHDRPYSPCVSSASGSKSLPPPEGVVATDRDLQTQVSQGAFIFGVGTARLLGKRKRGRPSYRDLYPLVPIVQRILNFHPSGANRQRSETTNYSTITMKELWRLTCLNIKQYCIDFGLPVPSQDKLPCELVIRRLGKASHANYKAASYYKNIVPFRTAPRNNNLTKWHQDFHLTAATVNLFSEMSTFFDDDIVFMSCDNKNKMRFGAPANANITRPRGMYLENDMPSLPDHSFPTKDAKIVPMGYMRVLDRRIRHESCNGRFGLKYVFGRPVRYLPLIHVRIHLG